MTYEVMNGLAHVNLRRMCFFMSPQLSIGAKKIPLKNGGLSSYYVTPVLYSGHDQRACKISRNRPVHWQGNKVQTLYRQDSPKQAKQDGFQNFSVKQQLLICLCRSQSATSCRRDKFIELFTTLILSYSTVIFDSMAGKVKNIES